MSVGTRHQGNHRMINMHSSACVAGETVSAVYTQVSLAGIYIVVSVQPSKKKKKKRKKKKEKICGCDLVALLLKSEHGFEKTDWD